MSATYDDTLPTDKDWVRFLTGDTNVASPLLQDEEIDAIISEEPGKGTKASKYCAAARALSALQARWAAAGSNSGGLTAKQVEDLSLRFGSDASSAGVLQKKIDELKYRCGYLLRSSPRSVRTFGGC